MGIQIVLEMVRNLVRNLISIFMFVRSTDGTYREYTTCRTSPIKGKYHFEIQGFSRYLKHY